jgi:hypothetical protein
MASHELWFPSLSAVDARTTDLEEIGVGEGFSVFTATFDGRPAVIVDEGRLRICCRRKSGATPW